MGNHQIRVITVLMLFLLSVMAPNIVEARYPSVALTPLEQAAKLSSVVSQTIADKLFPPTVETITPKSFYQRNYRSEWISSSLADRIKIAEKIGTHGVNRYATEHSWVKLLGSQGRGIRQGPDFIYWDRDSGKVRVIEAKGGSSSLKWTYGSMQGTNTNIIRSAKAVLESTKASQTEKLQAARVIEAARKNHLETGVVNTSHVLGKPRTPQLKGMDTEDVSKEAGRIKRELVKTKPGSVQLFKKAGTVHRVDRLNYFTTTKGMATLWRPLQTAWLQRVGQATGRWFLPIAVGVEGLRAGGAYYEYALGRTSQREFYRQSAGPTIFAVFTTGGTIVGGGIPGAAFGAILAVPAQFAGDWMLNWYYRKFDEKKLRLVDVAVEKFYGLEVNTT